MDNTATAFNAIQEFEQLYKQLDRKQKQLLEGTFVQMEELEELINSQIDEKRMKQLTTFIQLRSKKIQRLLYKKTKVEDNTKQRLKQKNRKDVKQYSGEEFVKKFDELTKQRYIKVPNLLLESVEAKNSTDRLTTMELVLLLQLINLSKTFGYCFAKDKAFAESFNCTERTISDCLRSLEQKGFIQRVKANKMAPDFGSRHIFVNLKKLKSVVKPNKD